MATKATSPILCSTLDRATDYAERVLSGEIVAGPHVRNACRRHLDDLKHGPERGLWFDYEAAERAYSFFESKLHLSEGQFEDEPFSLHAAQAFIVGSIFGWKRADGFRRFRRAYIEQGKGNGKSPLAGGIGLIGLTADREPGAEIYSAGATKDQAAILFRDAVKMVRKSPDLLKRLRFSGGEGREYNIAFLAQGSFFRPVSRETKKTGSGPRPHFALCDEVHEHPDRGTMEMLERGFKFRRQPLLFMITNSGTDRNSVAWEEHVHAIRVAAGNRDAKHDDSTYLGEPIDDRTFSYVCALDLEDDPLTDPSCWIKANPLLGVTITEEYLSDVVKQARDLPGQLNGILRLHFCVWTDADTAWMTRELLEPCIADFDEKKHKDKAIAIGLDLSRNRDITAMAVIVKTGEVQVPAKRPDGVTELVAKPTFDAWVEAWTPGDTMKSREELDKLPYSIWAKDGFLHAPSGSSISYLHVAQTLAEYDHDYRISLAAYDRYAFRKFEEDVDALGLQVEFAEHPQGGVRKGKATEAMIAAAKSAGRDPEGLWMPSSLRLLEDAILERRIRFKRNPVLISAMMSAVVDQDKWENRWLAKAKSTNKIDCAVALCMAMGAANATVSAPKYELVIF